MMGSSLDLFGVGSPVAVWDAMGLGISRVCLVPAVVVGIVVGAVRMGSAGFSILCVPGEGGSASCLFSLVSVDRQESCRARISSSAG